ncbi:hypothetical protein HYE68_001474 [Fusarium pseudograminearum]|nr:hypothetical protein HYE68_001474 [Fusarium pseudograminearum]
MKVVAVAGGTGSVGSSIIDGLVDYGKHKERPTNGAVNYLKVDYSDVDATTKALEEANVNIVICAIAVISPEANQAQKNLIQAAAQSRPTERFVISSFDALHMKEDVEIAPWWGYTFEAIDLLEKTSLVYTRIANGWFLDYYGMPHWKTNLEPWLNVLNMESKWAAIPGDGAKFEVAVDSLEKLKSGKISFFPDYPPIGMGDGDEAFFATIHYLAGIGRYLVPRDLPFLDDKFSDLKVTTASEVMESSWKGQ